MSGMLSIGISGINAASVNLATTSHNITNADTDGYSRQRAVQATNTAVATGAGYIGQGTHVTTVERMYSAYLDNSLNSAQTKASALDSYYTEMSKIDNMLSETNAGLATALDSFFTGVNDAATNPSQSSSRQSMISSAQALVSRYRALDDQLDTLYGGVNSQITSTVESINTYARQIAALNEQIVKAQAATSQPPNDLLDQRDELVADLNKLVGVTTTTDTNGSYNVFFGTGQQLVVGTQVTSLTAMQSSADASRITVGIATSGDDQELPESLVTGGALGGLLAFRSESLDKTANDLGLNATALALTFNAQFALGMDANGKASGEGGFESNFFSLSTTVKTIASSNNVTDQALSITLSTPTYKEGSFSTDLTGSDYRLVNEGGDLKLTRLSDGKQWPTAPATITTIAELNDLLEADPQGFVLSDESLTLNAGDSYLIRPTRDASGEIAVNTVVAADTDLLNLAAPMRTATGTGNTGSATISEGSVSPGYVVLDDNVDASNPVQSINLTYSSGSPGTISWGDVYDKSGNLTIAAGSVDYASGSTITVAGNSFTISGTPNDGDTFTISRNTTATSDARNALALVGMQTQKTIGGTATYESNYATLVSYVGNKTNELKATSDAQESLVTQASDAVEALSGVNLNEEAALLIKYQEAYQASAKIISIASELFDTILQIKS